MPDVKRQKLTIKEAYEPKSFGTKGGQKVEFPCSDGKKWVTYKKSLFQYIIAGAEIDADTEIKEQPHENGIYKNYIVHDIYIDGKSVSPQSKPYQRNDDSPEKRASIETQQAADFTTRLWIADKLEQSSPEVTALRVWLLVHLNPKEPQKPAETPKTKPPSKGESAVDPENHPEIILAVPKGQERDPLTIKTYTQLCKACNEDFGMQPNQVLKELNVNLQSEITQTMPDCYVAIAAVMEGPKE